MTIGTKVLSDAVQAALNQAVVGDDFVDLASCGQLDRKLYVEVNDALVRVGGKWDRNRKVHVFQANPAVAIAALLTDGIAPAKNPLAYYATPLSVASMLVDKIEMDDLALSGAWVDPSCGAGALLLAAQARLSEFLATRSTPSIMGIEIDAGRADTARQLGFPVRVIDFLSVAVPFSRVSVILMNPPYATEGEPLAWVDHLYHALNWLRPGGQLAAILPASISSRTTQRITAIRELALRTGGLEPLPDGTFTGSGTGVRTCMVWLRKV